MKYAMAYSCLLAGQVKNRASGIDFLLILKSSRYLLMRKI